VVLQGQTTPDRETTADVPVGRRSQGPKSQEERAKVRLALNLAVNKKTIVNALWKGMGSEAPFMYWYTVPQGFSKEWKVPPTIPSAPRSSWPRPVTRRLRGPREIPGQ